MAYNIADALQSMHDRVTRLERLSMNTAAESTQKPLDVIFEEYNKRLPPETPYTRSETWKRNQNSITNKIENMFYEAFENRKPIPRHEWIEGVLMRYDTKWAHEIFCPSALDEGYCYKWHNYHGKWIKDHIENISSGKIWGEGVPQPT
jgi:hypothetical protein